MPEDPTWLWAVKVIFALSTSIALVLQLMRYLNNRKGD